MDSFITEPRGAHPIVRGLVAFPIACFSCALITDLAYWRTADMLWADFSDWLLAVGMAMGGLAAIAAGVDALVHRRQQRTGSRWILAAGGIVTLALALFDNLVHSRDAWTSVVPWGAALSAATVVVMLATALLNASRHPPRAVGYAQVMS